MLDLSFYKFIVAKKLCFGINVTIYGLLITMIALLIIFLSFTISTESKSAVLITATEVGNDVVFNYSGSIDTSLLNTGPNDILSGDPRFISPFVAGFSNLSAGTLTIFNGYISPANFGVKVGQEFAHFADSGTGDSFWIRAQDLKLSEGYVSNSDISGSMTFKNKSFNSLGVTPGTYNWTYQSGGATMVSLTTVPEPHEYAMVASLSLVGFALYGRKRLQNV